MSEQENTKSQKTGTGSIDGLMDSDGSVLVKLLGPNGDPILDDDGVECGFFVQHFEESKKCTKLTREYRQWAKTLPPNVEIPLSKQKAFEYDLVAGAVTDVQGRIVFDGEVIENKFKSIRRVIQNSRVIRKAINAYVGNAEAFTKSATEDIDSD